MKHPSIHLALTTALLFCGCGPKEGKGATFRKLLAEKIRQSDEIRITEISDRNDLPAAGVFLDGETPEYEYATVRLDGPRTAAFLTAVEAMDDRPQESFAACFLPHHRMTMTGRDGSVSTMIICLDCRGIRWEEASGLTKPDALYTTLETMMKSAGMHLEKDWPAMAKERLEQHRAAEKKLEDQKRERMEKEKAELD